MSRNDPIAVTYDARKREEVGMAEKTFVDLGHEIGELLREKNAAYGNAFEESEKILRVLFPDGVPVAKYQDFLTITRIIDKLFRIATDKNAFSEDPWQDIAGYAILSLWSQQTEKPVVHENGDWGAIKKRHPMIRKRISDLFVCVSERDCFKSPACDDCPYLVNYPKRSAEMSDGTTRDGDEVLNALVMEERLREENT